MPTLCPPPTYHIADAGPGTDPCDAAAGESGRVALRRRVFVLLVLALPQPRPLTRARRPADPRRHSARADLDGDSSRDPGRDRHVRARQAAGDQRHRLGKGGGPEAHDHRRGSPVLLELHLSERRHPGGTDESPGGPRHPTRGQVPRRRPQLVDPVATGQIRRDPRQDEPSHLSRRPCRHVSGPVRRVLRLRARAHARDGRGAPERRLPRCF